MVLSNCSWMKGHSMTQSFEPSLLFKTRAPCIESGIPNDVITVFTEEFGKEYEQLVVVILALNILKNFNQKPEN